MQNINSRNAANEETRLLENLKEALKAKKKKLNHFGEIKLEAYTKAEVLASGVRLFKFKSTTDDYPKVGQAIRVNYTGYLPNGRIFDSGIFTFNLGKKEVIKAWDIAFKHLRLGEEAIIFCPSSTAYDKRGAGKDIKSYTTLIFDVALEKLGE